MKSLVNGISLLIVLSVLILNSGCGRPEAGPAPGSPENPGAGPAEPPVGGGGDIEGLYVASRAYFTYSTDKEYAMLRQLRNLQGLFLPTAFASNPASAPLVTVVNAANVTMSLNTAGFGAPGVITSDVLAFGNIVVSNLKDNDLKHCGTGGNHKCNTALFRIYTTGQPGDGFWNTVDSYGAPITATGTLSGIAGLGSANSVIVQTYTIPSNKNVVKETDFSPAPSYSISGDFSNAGAGSYSATVVVEFALAP